MEKEELESKLSKLETINDQLQAEIYYLNKLLKQVGFDEGIETLRSAAMELLEIEQKEGKIDPKTHFDLDSDESA